MNAYFVERVCEELGDLAMRMTSHMGMEKNLMNQTIMLREMKEAADYA